MLAVKFGMVTLSKAASYLILLLANAETVTILPLSKEPTYPSGLPIPSSTHSKWMSLCKL